MRAGALDVNGVASQGGVALWPEKSRARESPA